MDHIHLIFPPQVDPSYVPHHLSSCAKRLQLAGFDVQLSDDNQYAYQYFLEPARLQACLEQARRELHVLEAYDDLTAIQTYQYYRTVRAIMYGSVLSDQLATAWNTFAQQASLAQKKTRRGLQQALELASLPFFPTLIKLNDVLLTYSTQSTQDILKAVTDVQVNPYHDFWQHRLPDILREAPQNIVLWIEFDQQLIPAFTLAALLKATQTPARILLTGPFISTFQEIWQQEGAWSHLIDQCCATHELFGYLQGSETTAAHQPPQVWSLEGLPLERYLGQPLTISLPLDENEGLPGEGIQTIEQCEHLFVRMQALAQDHPHLRFHISTPLNHTLLQHLASLLHTHACTFAWGSIVAYGTLISPEMAQQLAQTHCRYLHLELKGYLGYSPEQDVAQRELLASWRALHQAGLRIACTVVYGHPLDNLATFPDFITFLTAHPAEVDALVRFKIFRLYRHSRFWDHPEDFHLWIEKDEAQTSYDLQRFFHFRTQAGFDSRTFHTHADQYIATLQKSLGELPNPPLFLDDWLFEEEALQENAPTAPLTFAEEALIHIAPETCIVPLAYPYQQLDQRWRQFLSTLTELPRLTEQIPVEKNTSTLLYTAAQDSLLGANEGVRRVISLCKQPIQCRKLLDTFPDSQKPALKKILAKLVQDGFLAFH